MPYSVIGDLLTGDMQFPAYIDPDKFVASTAEEIDAVIGQLYITPVVVATSPLSRSTMLILKKVNNFLASGRIILAMDAAGQNKQLHSYGKYMVTEAEGILKAITEGKITLAGATPILSGGGTAPVIVNAESTSTVDEFYSNFIPAWPPFIQDRVWFTRGDRSGSV